MADKYEDLADDIKQDRSLGPITGLDGETYALRWLDEHPDQAPGRTTTESEFRQAFDATFGTDSDAAHTAECFLACLGQTVVSDPEPTNAEKLEAALLDTFGLLEVLGNQGVHNLAFNLDKAGVKAPGGGDDR